MHMILRLKRHLMRLPAVRIGLLVLTSFRVVQAQEATQEATQEAVPYSLHWSREAGAESCIGVDSLARHLAQAVGYPSAAGENTTRNGDAITLEGRAQRAKAPNQFQVRLRVLDAHGEVIGERVLSTQKAQCSALNSALLLVLAMSVNPKVESERIPAEIANELNSEPGERGQEGAHPRENLGQAAGEIAGADPPKPLAGPWLGTVKLTKLTFLGRPLPRQHWFVFGGPAVAVNVVPRPTLGFVAGARRELPFAFSASLAAAAWVPRGAQFESAWSIPGGINVAAVQLRGEVCREVMERSTVALQACVGGHWGARWFLADGLEKQYLSTRQFYGPSLAVSGAVPLSSRVSIRGAVHLAAQFPRDQFTYVTPAGARQPLYRPSLFTGDAFLGAEVTL